MTTTDRNEGEEAVLRAYLRKAAPLPAYTPTEWERLSRRVMRAAAPALATRAPNAPWREDLVRLARVAVPVALAAGMAALVLLNHVETSASKDVAPVTAFLSAMAGETSRDEVLDLTLGQNSQALLLADRR